ncbi:MAG: Manganese and iron superoxide dismutase [Candidatus Nomurabacteria bacterium GW2011_GWF2_43_8]|uniref:superoxide dismutase n=3 Tax=Candidatus Nomuraibacteriota TaxID=1752729 RepID=A0A0G1FMJ3_9BACT|nr:MAG: Manganese and iron superoxide dismutase [Candidatus Nomurabacteria bacterium GW2011_GWA2_43_15]KKT18869.1 MAG: Manganese and iron superoxide dismutase [Candidatus Nomurabacteria bacterium GW2011_GWB1_43_7]KKT23198.1 MAG: Manganese and iron superoxide dismutase [Candidatus Nomurabacteria bacterium GW2011_GWF2_43_8]
MKKFEELKFNIGPLKGISAKNVEEHLKLYTGYVKNANSVLEKIPEYEGYTSQDVFAPYVVNELHRRFSFEYNGMRNHEIYFESLSGGAYSLDEKSKLREAIMAEWGSFDLWLNRFKSIATTRGIGWAMLYFDKKENRLLNAWVDEQHLGQLQNCAPIIALDMWEHAFVADYQPSGKKQYIEDFFENLNWEVIEKNFTEAQ